MRYSSRFFLYAPFVGLLLLAALAAGIWWSDADALAKRLDAANGREIIPGVRFAFTQKRLAGFPFRVDIILENLRIETMDANGPIGWRTENFAMHELAYGREQSIMEAAGRQGVWWKDARGISHQFTFLPGTFRASALVRDGKLSRFDAEIADLDGAEFRAANLQLHFRAVQERLDVYLELQNAHISDGYAVALGPQIATLTARGHLNKGDLLQGLLAGSKALVSTIDAWRQGGGTITVDEFSLTKEARTQQSFAGKLTLDETDALSGILHGAKGGALVFSGDRLQLGSGLSRP